MKRYKQYVKECRLFDTGWNPNTFTMDVNGKEIGIEVPYNYDHLVNRIAIELRKKLRKGKFEEDVRGIVSKIDDPLSIPEVIELGEHFNNEMAEKFYGGECVVKGVYPYRNNIVDQREGASWLWHYDNAAPGIIKLMVYLTPTTKETGAFLVLRNQEGEHYRMEPSTVAPKRILKPVWKGSRVPNEVIEQLKREGYHDYYVEGDTGTFAVFNNNIIHKATIPKKSPARLCIIYMFRPYHDKLNKHITPEITQDWSNQGHIKSRYYFYDNLV
jgi:hypothetical protein